MKKRTALSLMLDYEQKNNLMSYLKVVKKGNALFKGLFQSQQKISKEILSGQTPVQNFKDDCGNYIQKAKYFGFFQEKSQMTKEQYEIKIKYWKHQKKELQKIKKEQQQKKLAAQTQKRLKDQKQLQEQIAFQKLKRIKIAQNKIQQILQRKAKRNKIIQNSRIKIKKQITDENSQQYSDDFEMNPQATFQKKKRLYKLYEIDFLQKQKQREQQRKQFLSARKQKMQVSLEHIRLRNQFSKRKNKKPSLQNKVKQQLQLHMRLQEQRAKLRGKLSVLKQLQNSISQLPLSIDLQKRKQQQIRNDKAQNAKKYLILGRRAMSDSKIYERYKDVEVQVDGKALGNQYLKQFTSKKIRVRQDQLDMNGSGVHRANSIIQELKVRRKTRSQQIMATINTPKQGILNSYEHTVKKQKNKVPAAKYINTLLEQSQEHDRKAYNKIIELKSVKKYENGLKKESQIDQHYTQALKAKIAALQMS